MMQMRGRSVMTLTEQVERKGLSKGEKMHIVVLDAFE